MRTYTAETLSTSIGTAIGSISEGVATSSFEAISTISQIGESGISTAFNPSFGAELAPIIINTPRFNFPEAGNLLSLPEHTIDFARIGVDRTVPSPEIVLNSRLFEAIKPLPHIESITEPQFEIAIKQMETGADSKAGEVAANIIESLGFEKDAEFAWLNAVNNIIEEKTATHKPEVELSPFGHIESLEAALSEREMAKLTHKNAEIITTIKKVPTQTLFTEVKEVPALVMDSQDLIELTPTIVQVAEQPEAETAVKTKIETKTEIAMEPPKPPISVALGQIEPEQEPEPAQLLDSLWEMYTTTHKKVVAEDSLKKRLKVAGDIVTEAQSKTDQLSLEKAVEARLYKLETPDPFEFIEILNGRLEYPTVSYFVQFNLLKVEDKGNPKAISNALSEAVKSRAPKRKTKNVRFEGLLMESELPPDPQSLAISGAEHIALKRQRWISLKTAEKKDPVEFDKVKVNQLS